ncbi:MAG: hypothetical protein ACRDL7_05720 [Gaiellaceae bacterium]
MSAELRHALRARLERVLVELDAAQRIVSAALTRARATQDEQSCFDLLERIASISDAARFFVSELN